MTLIHDGMKLTHKVNFTLEKQYRTDVFSPNYHYQWTLKGGCDECGWFHTVTRNGEGERGQVSSITQHDEDEMLQKHALGIGIFFVPKTDGKVGNDVFLVEEDGAKWQMLFRNGDWQYIPV